MYNVYECWRHTLRSEFQFQLGIQRSERSERREKWMKSIDEIWNLGNPQVFKYSRTMNFYALYHNQSNTRTRTRTRLTNTTTTSRMYSISIMKCNVQMDSYVDVGSWEWKCEFKCKCECECKCEIYHSFELLFGLLINLHRNRLAIKYTWIHGLLTAH